MGAENGVASADERARRDRAFADSHAARALDELVLAEAPSSLARERGVHREVAACFARLAEVYAMRDLARSNRELAEAMRK